MGTARNEISGFGETGNHPPGRTVPSSGGPDVGKARHPAIDILPLVDHPRPAAAFRHERLGRRSVEPPGLGSKVLISIQGYMKLNHWRGQSARDDPAGADG